MKQAIGIESVLNKMETFVDGPKVCTVLSRFNQPHTRIDFLPNQHRKIKAKIGSCYVDGTRDGNYTHVVIMTDSGIGIGTSIMSITDSHLCAAKQWMRGSNMAIERALFALENRKNSLSIRCNFEDFDDDWTKEQMLNVMNCPVNYKSIYVEV